MSRIQPYTTKNTSGGNTSLTITNTEERLIKLTSISTYSDKDSEIKVTDNDSNVLYRNNQEAYCNFNDSPSKGILTTKSPSLKVEITDSTALAYLNFSIEWGSPFDV